MTKLSCKLLKLLKCISKLKNETCVNFKSENALLFKYKKMVEFNLFGTLSKILIFILQPLVLILVTQLRHKGLYCPDSFALMLIYSEAFGLPLGFPDGT